MLAFQTGRVNRCFGPLADQATVLGAHGGLDEEENGLPLFEQPLFGLAESGVVWCLVQAEVVAQFSEVNEQLDHAAVIGLEEGLQGQQGEKLRLSEIPARELRGVSGQGFLSEAQCLLSHRTRRLGHGSWGSCSSHGQD